MSSDQMVVVRFHQPVEGVDSDSGEGFTSDRHTVACSEVHQTHEWTRFTNAAGSEAARWPTSMVQSIRWPSPPAPEAHGDEPVADMEIADAPDEPDPDERRLEERLAYRSLLTRGPVEVDRPELAGWDDISEKTLALGNQSTRARHWDAAPSSARQQCPVCGDRLVVGMDHPCLR